MCVSRNTACTPFLGALLTINPQRAHTLEVVTAHSEQEQQAQSSGNINDSPGEAYWHCSASERAELRNPTTVQVVV